MGGGDGGMKVSPTSVTEAMSGGLQEHSLKQPWILLVVFSGFPSHPSLYHCGNLTIKSK